MRNHKKTVLHTWHGEHWASMVLFGNYNMPLWYKTGVKAEHLAVIQAAGYFDTSHMAVVSVKGKGSREVLQRCLTKDLDACLGKGRPLVDGRCVYGLFLQEDGTVIDDAIVYQLQAEHFMVVVNASMGRVIVAHLDKNQPKDLGLVVEDLTDRVGKMDLQGPQSARILKKIIKAPEALFQGLNYFSFKGGFGDLLSLEPVELVDGTPLLVSRTGYTGEFGFELFVASEKLILLWSQVLEAGKEYKALACGLAARDSLRAGAVLALSHQDIGPWPFLNNPWQFALAWRADGRSFSKNFIGDESLLQHQKGKYTFPFAGFDPRKIPVDENSYVKNLEDDPIGKILTCTTDMAIGRLNGEIVSVAGENNFQPRGLCCGFVLLDRKYNSGDIVVLTGGKRQVKVEIRMNVRPNRTARSPIAMMIE